MSAELAATGVGDYRDLDTVLAFAETVDVVTFDHEHVPPAILRELVSRGIPVHPGPDALLYAQDKLQMRAKLSELGLPGARLGRGGVGRRARRLPRRPRRPRGREDRPRRLRRQGRARRVRRDRRRRLVPRARRGRPRRSPAGGGARLLPARARPAGRAPPVRRDRRLAGRRDRAARRRLRRGDRAGARARPDAWPSVAAEIARRIADGLGVTGVLAVELFETTDGRVLVNELAMRPHNSGHWSIEGAVTSQFEQHLRAVLDLPLGATGRRATTGR